MQGSICVCLYFQGKGTSHLSSHLLSAVPDTSALHSWHIASLRSKKHHAADIFLLPEMYFTAPKCSTLKVMVLKKLCLQIRVQNNPVTERHCDNGEISGIAVGCV